jgi:hypothetical protein
MVNCPESGNNGWGEQPSITVVYHDLECDCEKTKPTVAPTHGMPAWWDDELKCSVTSTDVASTSGHGWGKPTAPAETSSNGWGKPVAPAETSSNGWGKPVAPAETSSNGWGKPVAPAETSSAGGDWNKPVAPAAATTGPVKAYTGAATKLGGSALALVAVFAGALAL